MENVPRGSDGRLLSPVVEREQVGRLVCGEMTVAAHRMVSWPRGLPESHGAKCERAGKLTRRPGPYLAGGPLIQMPRGAFR